MVNFITPWKPLSIKSWPLVIMGKDRNFSWPSCPSSWECVSLEHTFFTALAVLLYLLCSLKRLWLPACLVRICKQEEERSSRCFLWAGEGWGISFVLKSVSFNPQIGSFEAQVCFICHWWHLTVGLWNVDPCCQDGSRALVWESLDLGVQWGGVRCWLRALRWHPMCGGGGAGQLNVLFCNSWPGGASVTGGEAFHCSCKFWGVNRRRNKNISTVRAWLGCPDSEWLKGSRCDVSGFSGSGSPCHGAQPFPSLAHSAGCRTPICFCL